MLLLLSLAWAPALHAEPDNGRDPYAEPDPLLKEDFELENAYRAEAEQEAARAEFGDEEEETTAGEGARAAQTRDHLIQDDLIVVGSECIGLDCSSGESFGFDTLRLKENNVRIRFTDTSASSSFPTRDWEITVNDSSNGGVNKFSIQDIDASKTPFTILADANANALFVSTGGRVGFNTSSPSVSLHTLSGNTPTLRLDQDGSSGFSAQAWDIGGNETNFFVRDVTSSSKLPFRIQTGASADSIFVASDGDVGFETSSPDGQFDIAHYSDANNHAFFVSPTSTVGVNIDNGFLPRGLFDVNSTGGISRFMVNTDGTVGIGMGTSDTPAGTFHVGNNTSGDTLDDFVVTSDGLVGIGTTAPDSRYKLQVTAADTARFGLVDGSTLTEWGFAAFGSSTGYGGSFGLNARGHGTKLFIDRDSGNVGIGTLAPEEKLHVSGNIVATGTINGNFVASSSRSFKENIRKVERAEYKKMLKNLMDVDISTYNYKKDHGGDGTTKIGFIAEELPGQVVSKNGKGVDIYELITYTIGALKAQQDTILKQQEELERLKALMADR